jgi:mannose-1-phosphate guanylyltransferase / mannose-6-phosphate isomerase
LLNFLILAGGGGTRLWPLSRQDYPKQFQSLDPEQQGLSSLLLDTLARLKPEINQTNIHLLTSADLATATEAALRHAGLTHLTRHIIAEPLRRNTAPAIALAAQRVAEQAGWLPATPIDLSEQIICVLPADHSITDKNRFYQQLLDASELAKDGTIVTLGITPNRPETGYGYIEADQPIAGRPGMPVKQFVEKPDAQTAQVYVDSGRFFWNAGIFVLSIGTLMASLQQHAPDIYTLVSQGYEQGLSQFASMPNISFDYAVMEKATKVAVIPLDNQWSDIGSWDSAFDGVVADGFGNKVAASQSPQTAPVLWDSRHNHVWTNSGRTIALLGVNHVTVVDTPDATLICQKGTAQDVRYIVQELTQQHSSTLSTSRLMAYPWGQVETLSAGSDQYPLYRVALNAGELLYLTMNQDTLSLTVTAGQLMLQNPSPQTVKAGQTMAPGSSPVMVKPLEPTQLIVIGALPVIVPGIDDAHTLKQAAMAVMER